MAVDPRDKHTVDIEALIRLRDLMDAKKIPTEGRQLGNEELVRELYQQDPRLLERPLNAQAWSERCLEKMQAIETKRQEAMTMLRDMIEVGNCPDCNHYPTQFIALPEGRVYPLHLQLHHAAAVECSEKHQRELVEMINEQAVPLRRR